MKIIVNASTLVIGGGIQVGVSFKEHAIENTDFEWLFLVSKGIYENLNYKLKLDERIVCIVELPAKIVSWYKSRKIIKRYVNKFNPILIYSIGFPSYIRFRKIEIGRYTNPWEFNPKPLPWHIIDGLLNKLKIRLGGFWKKCHVLR